MPSDGRKREGEGRTEELASGGGVGDKWWEGKKGNEGEFTRERGVRGRVVGGVRHRRSKLVQNVQPGHKTHPLLLRVPEI